MATAQQCHTLTSYFLSAYEKEHGRKSRPVNRNKARWIFDSILMDMSPVEVKELIDYYMRTSGSHNHSFEWFANNYERLATSKEEQEADRRVRERLMAETRERTERWRRERDSSRETD